MSLKAHISDPTTGIEAEVVDGIDQKALVVATRPLKDFENSLRFFTNSEHGANLNIDASTGGTPEKVNDGTDSALWNASDIVGGVSTTFNSTDQNHTATGTKSVKVEDANIDDVFQFLKSSALDCSGYVSLTLWIYIDKDWKAGDSISIYGFNTGTGLVVGDAVLLENYLDYNNQDVWQKVSIPLLDFGSMAGDSIDALRIKQIEDERKAPKYYLDDIQFEQIGTPVTFELAADKETWLHVESFTFSLADAMAGTLADGTMPYLAYDKMLGETLVAGIIYKRTQNGVVKYAINVKSLLDLLQLAGSEVSASGSDGTNTWVTIITKHIAPIILKNGDVLSFTISEDLTGLLHFRISAGCKIENR